jgi:hypothetical protein
MQKLTLGVQFQEKIIIGEIVVVFGACYTTKCKEKKRDYITRTSIVVLTHGATISLVN